MGRRGPAPKPTALRLMEGQDVSSRPLPTNEPKPEAKMPHCPSHLTSTAKTEWRRLAKELYKLGLLTAVDRAALAGYCQIYGRWVAAEKELAESGKLIHYTEKGYPIVNPLIPQINALLTQMNRYMREFGLTPAARANLAVIPTDDKKTAEERKAARLLGA